jgi:NADH-quinone oxidoreductase subunit A
MTKITPKIDMRSMSVIVLHGTIPPFVIQICQKDKFAIWRTYESVDLHWSVLYCWVNHPGRLAWVLGPKKANPIKQTTYECGIETVGDSWVQFKAQYYIFALVFLIFDVETVFLFPWAVRLGQLGLFAVIEGLIFILILIAGLVYTWRKGLLEWA